ncbi:terminase [Mycolicibacterium peregrinum]|uniref:terminase n=1 Tax=Mycolicibacterium peregrinum TaxID=43304 RepID=UPI003AAC599B
MATSWPRVKATCRNIGWRFDPWQDAVGRLILAKKEGGKWAADLSLLSIPRQVGKSYLLGCIIFALCLLTPKLRVIWTSHHTATTEEMYEAMKELAQHRRVAPHVTKCIALQGSRWRIQFRNGSRIDFGARSQGFGRGKAKVGVLVLDEFQHITSRALANLAPTTNTADNPLILCAGTPPGPEVSGEAFTMRRKAALEGITDDALYVEFSADQDADLDDRRQWAKANPSFPKRTQERAFLLLRKVLDEDDFRREGLGIWDEESRHNPIVTAQQWRTMVDLGPDAGLAPDALGVDMSHGRDISVGACWVSPEPNEDGRYPAHIEEVWSGSDPAAVIDWIVVTAGRRMPVVIDSASPAASLAPDLRARKCNVVMTSAPKMADACGLLENRINTKTLTHGGQKAITDGYLGARRRLIRDAGGWALDRSDPASAIYPAVATTLALYGASIGKRNTSKGRVVVLS